MPPPSPPPRSSFPAQAATSIIIPSAGQTLADAPTSMLERCLASLALLDPPPLEVIVAVGDEFCGDRPSPLGGLPLRFVHRGPGKFDFSRAVNCGLLASTGDLILMLNDDTEAESSEWLGRMAAHLEDPSVGAVGAALFYPDRSVQHLGIELGDAQSFHPFQGCQWSEAVAAGADAAHDVLSITGACLLARRRDLLAVGGLSQEFPVSYGDVDLCLRMIRLGWRVVIEPSATLIHHESASRPPVIEPWESKRFRARWGGITDSLPLVAEHGDNPAAEHGDNPAAGRRYDSSMGADPVESEDPEQLLHEILRLRALSLGAEAANLHLVGRVSNQDDKIDEMERVIAEREIALKEWEDRVAERDIRIAERDIRITERDARIADRDNRIAQLEAENLRLQEELGRPAIIRLARRLVRGPRRHG